MKQNNSGGENLNREAAEEVFKRTGISGDRRPETLENDEFAALAGALEEFVLHG
jgi:16S rRNA A1518/A1519 N6-dimethyltransferase RsmA/KsgA/DIM1 with predicted DNA glycosylase/AP lyase activity